MAKFVIPFAPFTSAGLAIVENNIYALRKSLLLFEAKATSVLLKSSMVFVNVSKVSKNSKKRLLLIIFAGFI